MPKQIRLPASADVPSPGSYDIIRVMGIAFRPGRVVAQYVRGTISEGEFTILERGRKSYNELAADTVINAATSVENMKDRIVNNLKNDYPGSTAEDIV